MEQTTPFSVKNQMKVDKSAPCIKIEGETGRNEAVFAAKLTIDNLEGETGQIEAVHAENCSEAATAQHLHDSTVTTISFEGDSCGCKGDLGRRYTAFLKENSGKTSWVNLYKEFNNPEKKQESTVKAITSGGTPPEGSASFP